MFKERPYDLAIGEKGTFLNTKENETEYREHVERTDSKAPIMDL